MNYSNAHNMLKAFEALEKSTDFSPKLRTWNEAEGPLSSLEVQYLAARAGDAAVYRVAPVVVVARGAV